jgi:hypothetical protein
MFSILSDLRANKTVKEEKERERIKGFLSFSLNCMLLGGGDLYLHSHTQTLT